MASLREKVAVGSAWMVGMRLSINLMGLFSTVILARLLTPEDFGITALAGSAYAFFSVLGQFGFDTVLIHQKNPSKKHYDTAWTANILVGLAIAVSTSLIAKPVSIFFGDTRIEQVIYAFSVLSLLKGFENIGIVNFRKNLAFRGDYFFFVLPKLVAIIVAFITAVIIRNYWALVLGMLSAQLVALLYSYLSQPLRPSFSLAKFSEMFNYTRWILGNNVLNFASINGIDVIIGKLLDSATVGVFGVARQVAFLPTQEISAPINRALFPGVATIADDQPRVRHVFYQVFAMTCLLTLPAAFGILAIADSIVLVLFGSQWTGVTPILAILGFIGAIEALRGACGPVLLSRGKPNILTKTLGAYVVFLLPAAIFAGNRYGAPGVAYSMLIGSLLTTPYMIRAVLKDIGGSELALIARFFRPLIASVVMAVMANILENYLTGILGTSALVLVILLLCGVLFYALLLMVIWRVSGKPAGAEVELVRLIDGFRRRIH